MKYYICDLTTAYGAIDFNSTIRFRTDGDDLDYARKIASTFWGESGEEVEEGVYNFPNYTTCFVGCVNEVSKEVYDALHAIIVELEANV